MTNHLVPAFYSEYLQYFQLINIFTLHLMKAWFRAVTTGGSLFHDFTVTTTAYLWRSALTISLPGRRGLHFHASRPVPWRQYCLTRHEQCFCRGNGDLRRIRALAATRTPREFSRACDQPLPASTSGQSPPPAAQHHSAFMSTAAWSTKRWLRRCIATPIHSAAA